MALLDVQLQPPLLALTRPPESTAWSGGHLQQRGLRSSRKLFAGAAAAAVVSLVMLVAVFAVCRARLQRPFSQGAEHRSLSYGGDDGDQLSSIIEECLDLQEEHGLQLPAPEHVEEREAKDKLIAMVYASAEAFEQRQALASSYTLHYGGSSMAVDEGPESMDTTPAQPLPAAVWGGHSGVAVAPVGGLATEGEGFFFSGGQQWDAPFSANAHSSGFYNEALAGAAAPAAMDGGSAVGSGIDGAGAWQLGSLPFGNADTAAAAALAPDAWLADPSADEFPPVVHQGAEPVQSSLVQLLIGTNTGQSDLHAHAPPVPEWAPVPGWAPSASEEMVARQQPENPAVAHAPVPAAASTASQPTTSMETTGSSGGKMEGQRRGPDWNLHPFVRLPMVDPRVVQRLFRPEFALSLNMNIPSPMDSYTTMRRLFAKPSLTARDVETLMLEAENLANYARDKLTRPCVSSKSSYIFRKLSSIFMAFDYLVSTIQLLGEKMLAGLWWNEFASMFQTEFHFAGAASMKRTRRLTDLVNRLSVALSIYKRGCRPPAGEIIELKRMILTQQCKGNQLSNPLWALWLEDDSKFRRSIASWGNPPDVQVRDEQQNQKKDETKEQPPA
ncbi:hypothetical protein, conserved [Eimeria brunetti]|uniref:Uncharacterized protein n=1 Tax=Eimeria brunetti TaxID=51314 RepID=U6LKD0_9EIME|nr:hypothetical protein, conserved [Eimeria brunetti]